MEAPKPLVSRLRSARILVREYRHALVESERDRTPGAPPEMVPPEIKRELARFDAALDAVSEAICALAPREGV